MKQFPVLYLYVDSESPELQSLYKDHIEKHNNHVTNDVNANSGFDLIVPEAVEFPEPHNAKLVNHKVKAAMFDAPFSKERDSETSGIMRDVPFPYTNTNTSMDLESKPYYLYARSSIYKYPLSLANSVGIIDSGYRGWLCSALRLCSNNSYTLNEGVKITQICHRMMTPFLVKLVNDENELGITTRGENGFGSTSV